MNGRLPSSTYATQNSAPPGPGHSHTQATPAALRNRWMLSATQVSRTIRSASAEEMWRVSRLGGIVPGSMRLMSGRRFCQRWILNFL